MPTPNSNRGSNKPPSTSSDQKRRPPSASASAQPTAASAARPLPVAAGLATGWHQLEDAVYHADPCPLPSLSSSIANLVINKSLMHAWRAHPRSPLFEESVMGSSTDRGSAAHSVLFGGRMIETIEAEDWRTAAAREAREAARAKGRIPLLAREMAGLAAMIEPALQRFHDLHGGAYLCEQTAVWRRARIDTLSESRVLIVDYKTTEAAVDAHTCERRIADMGLQLQAAAYVEAVEALHPELQGRVRFIFQWQEQKPPYALSPPIEMSEAFLTLGRAQWQAAGRLWDQALRHNAFPGYSAQPYPACPPPWELSRWEERAMLEALPSGGAL